MEGQLRDTASKSSLSSWVKNLLCKVGCDNTSTEEGYQPNSDLALDQDSDVDHCPKKLQSNSMPRIVTNNSQILNNGHIDMELLTALLPEYIEPPTEYFMKAVTRLAPVFQKCKEYLAGHRPNEFAYKYEDNFSWTKNKKLFLQCFELLTDTKGPDELLALLLLCGGLERALRNLYCLKGNQCPALLKDLLCTSELESYLGTAAIKILHVVIGPPTSMNLRNVSWHGFLKESELPRRYIFFLLLFTASVGKLLQNRGISMDSIQCRGYVSLSKVNDIAKHLGAVHLDVLALGNCILQSWLVDQGNINVFKSAFAFFAEQKHGWCMVLLFPLLEHGLRRLFVVANGCPERLVTAEATMLYTTFEEILDSRLPDGRSNAIVDILKEPCLDLLYDLLVYPIGPRARDKLSHGEADFDSVPQSLVEVVVLIMTYLAEGITDLKGSDSVEKPSNTALSCMQNYSSIFHPLSVLKIKIEDLASSAHQLHKDLRTLPSLDPWEVSGGNDVFLANNDMFAKIQASLSMFLHKLPLGNRLRSEAELCQFQQRITQPFQDLGEDLKSLLPSRIKTLYRWQRDSGSSSTLVAESEIVGLLTRIIDEVETCLTQTRSALVLRQSQLETKQLRSRQRENMKRLLAFLPCGSLLANYILVLCSWIFSNLDAYATLNDTQCKLLQRFLKSTLRTCENERSFTSAETNKWSQAAEATWTELKAAVQFWNENIFVGVLPSGLAKATC